MGGGRGIAAGRRADAPAAPSRTDARGTPRKPAGGAADGRAARIRVRLRHGVRRAHRTPGRGYSRFERPCASPGRSNVRYVQTARSERPFDGTGGRGLAVERPCAPPGRLGRSAERPSFRA